MTGPHLTWQDCCESCGSFTNFRGPLRYGRTLRSFRGELRTLFREAARKQLSCGAKVCIVSNLIHSCMSTCHYRKYVLFNFAPADQLKPWKVFPSQRAQLTCPGTGGSGLRAHGSLRTSGMDPMTLFRIQPQSRIWCVFVSISAFLCVLK